MNRTISPDELRQLKNTADNLQLIDVRKADDFATDPKLIPGAHHRLPEQVDQWQNDLASRDKIVVYCVHGHAVSNAVLDTLLAAGFDACVIDGGIEAWKAAGHPTEAGS